MPSLSISARSDSTSDLLAAIESRMDERLRHARVLVVDDDDLNLDAAKCVLEDFGVSVTTASSGFEALEVLQSDQFNCVFMDYQMPLMNGIETTLRIRADPRLATTCVIALTANASPRDRARYLEAGMNDVLGKPYQIEQLINVLLRNMDPSPVFHTQSLAEMCPTGAHP